MQLLNSSVVWKFKTQCNNVHLTLKLVFGDNVLTSLAPILEL